jgi:hypothetical protein
VARACDWQGRRDQEKGRRPLADADSDRARWFTCSDRCGTLD